MPLMFFRLIRLMASLLTMTLVQNGFIAADRLALHRPPGGLYAQHRTSAAGLRNDSFGGPAYDLTLRVPTLLLRMHRRRTLIFYTEKPDYRQITGVIQMEHIYL